MANPPLELAKRTFTLSDYSVVEVSEFAVGTVLPSNSVKVRLNQTTVHLNRPAIFSAAGPRPTEYLAEIREGIRVLQLAATLIESDGRLETTIEQRSRASSSS